MSTKRNVLFLWPFPFGFLLKLPYSASHLNLLPDIWLIHKSYISETSLSVCPSVGLSFGQSVFHNSLKDGQFHYPATFAEPDQKVCKGSNQLLIKSIGNTKKASILTIQRRTYGRTGKVIPETIHYCHKLCKLVNTNFFHKTCPISCFGRARDKNCII